MITVTFKTRILLIGAYFYRWRFAVIQDLWNSPFFSINTFTFFTQPGYHFLLLIRSQNNVRRMASQNSTGLKLCSEMSIIDFRIQINMPITFMYRLGLPIPSLQCFNSQVLTGKILIMKINRFNVWLSSLFGALPFFALYRDLQYHIRVDCVLSDFNPYILGLISTSQMYFVILELTDWRRA